MNAHNCLPNPCLHSTIAKRYALQVFQASYLEVWVMLCQGPEAQPYCMHQAVAIIRHIREATRPEYSGTLLELGSIHSLGPGA
jgi:hypothetical protein